MTVKEDFKSLFEGHETELRALTERFPIKNFNYMITSQRTMEMVHQKFLKIEKGETITHGNFWIDLRNLGLVKKDERALSDFGKASFEYFKIEDDEFKREHFILSHIRKKSYDMPDDIHQGYIKRIDNLKECLELIPSLNKRGGELLRNEEKLFMIEFLNTFPYALKKYFELSPNKQEAVDTLREGGLTGLFNQDDPYYKVAERLKNTWRALYRRTYFVKSIIISQYEERDYPLDKRVKLIEWEEIEESQIKELAEEVGDKTAKEIIKERLAEADADEDKMPKQIKVTTLQYHRNKKISAELKELYDYTCQICGEIILKPDGSRFIETHHIEPLGEGGIDKPSNMLVVCPNCHKKLDLKTWTINKDTIELYDEIEKEIYKLETNFHLEKKKKDISN
jgi:predicted HNH restriction endonuclease